MRVKPIMHIRIGRDVFTDTNNKYYRDKLIDVIKKKFGEKYDIIITPKEDDIEIYADNATTVNLNMNSKDNFKDAFEYLISR